MNTKLIGIGGTNGSGKDTVGKLLAEHYGYLFVSVTEILRQEAAKRGLPPARSHLRHISAEWRRENGLGVLVDKAVEFYREQGGDSKYRGLVMASLRNPGEVDRIHKLGGTQIWVDADPEVRYQRVQANAAARGEQRAVDDRKSFEEFLADERVEMQRSGDEATLDMSAVKEGADFVIMNNGTPEELLQKLNDLLEQNS